MTFAPALISGIVVGGSAMASTLAAPAFGEELLPFVQQGDTVSAALGALKGDVASGKAIVLDRRRGNCLICHVFPIEEEPFQGEIGPELTSVADRLDEGQIRLRMIDQSRINPETLMPPYYRIEQLADVAPEYVGKPALEAQEIEDVIAYLMTLRSE